MSIAKQKAELTTLYCHQCKKQVRFIQKVNCKICELCRVVLREL